MITKLYQYATDAFVLMYVTFMVFAIAWACTNQPAALLTILTIGLICTGVWAMKGLK